MNRRNVRKRRQQMTLTLIAMVLILAAFSSVATAAGSPRLLATSRCAHPCSRLIGVYKVRPKKVDLFEYAGGTLTLRWSRWGRPVAIGSGHGYYIGAGASYRYPLRVRARRIRHGLYTRLDITKTRRGESANYTLRLGLSYGDPAWLG
jgi:hypothetical protein